MIGMQEMLMQTHTSLVDVREGNLGKIRLLPAWPAGWDVEFKLHAPDQTTVEGALRQGQLTELTIIPESRRQDLIIFEGDTSK